MQTNKLLVSAVIALAIGVPIAAFLGAITMLQPTTSAVDRLPFFHGFPAVRTSNQAELASLERTTEWPNSLEFLDPDVEAFAFTFG